MDLVYSSHAFIRRGRDAKSCIKPHCIFTLTRREAPCTDDGSECNHKYVTHGKDVLLANAAYDYPVHGIQYTQTKLSIMSPGLPPQFDAALDRLFLNGENISIRRIATFSQVNSDDLKRDASQ